MNELLTEVFVEQPLASPGSAKDIAKIVAKLYKGITKVVQKVYNYFVRVVPKHYKYVATVYTVNLLSLLMLRPLQCSLFQSDL